MLLVEIYAAKLKHTRLLRTVVPARLMFGEDYNVHRGCGALARDE
jgi:hypothetical protein